MNRIFNKKDILTIPNLLSLFRLLMIPVIVWLYVKEKNYYAAAAMVLISGATDIADGIIARKFNMISDFGVKEFIMALLGYITIKSKDSVNSAKWYGKVGTFVLFVSMILMILIPDLPIVFVYILTILCAGVQGLALFMYIRFYIKILCER